MTAKFESLPHIEEGEYVATLVECRKGPPRFARRDLVMEFDVPDGDFGVARLRSHFQVSWVDENSFKAGSKSRFFRTYQVCFGPADSDLFEMGDFAPGKYLVEVVSVKRDGRWEELEPINQYSKVAKIKGVVSNV